MEIKIIIPDEEIKNFIDHGFKDLAVTLLPLVERLITKREALKLETDLKSEVEVPPVFHTETEEYIPAITTTKIEEFIELSKKAKKPKYVMVGEMMESSVPLEDICKIMNLTAQKVYQNNFYYKKRKAEKAALEQKVDLDLNKINKKRGRPAKKKTEKKPKKKVSHGNTCIEIGNRAREGDLFEEIAKDLEITLGEVQSNFEAYKKMFPNKDYSKVKY